VSAVGPAALGQGDQFAAVGRPQTVARRDLAHPGQTHQAALGLATQGFLVTRVGGEDDLIVVAAGGQIRQSRLGIDPALEPGLGRQRQGQDGQVQIDATRPSETSAAAVARLRTVSAKSSRGMGER
jgi:hypothetical protein